MKNKLVATSLALGLTLVGFLLVASSCSSKSDDSSGAPPTVAADTGADGTMTTVAAVPGDAAAATAAASAGDLVNLTMQLEPQRALGGHVKAGDRVAVVASFAGPDRTSVLAQKVAVANLQADVVAEDGENADLAPRGNLLVTLAVPPAEAARIVFALEYGRVWLAGENVATSTLGNAAVTAESVSPAVAT
jgi:pilus assembly protein CpaB